MRIVDTFLFSESHEAELLLAKLHVEEELVDHWIAVENAYDIKGIWKGTALAETLADPRFERFRQRLTVLTLERRFVDEYAPSVRDRVGLLARQLIRSEGAVRGYRERPFFFSEAGHRDAATQAVRDLAGPDGWVLVSDVDEMVDGSDDARATIERGMSWGTLVHLPRRRFVFDFDNVSMAAFRYVPLIRASLLGRFTLGELRLKPVGIAAGVAPLVFEYSYCYDREALARKLKTFTHSDPGEDIVSVALECNHALVRRPTSNAHWYEKVGIEEAGHPRYIVDNLDELRTNAVNPDYRAARAARYPELFGIGAGAVLTERS